MELTFTKQMFLASGWNSETRLKLSSVHPLNIDDGLAHILRLKILIIYIPRDYSASEKLVEFQIIMFLLESVFSY